MTVDETSVTASTASPGPKAKVAAVNSENPFEAFSRANQPKSDELVSKVMEVTGIYDRKLITKAFNVSKKAGHESFDVALAIEWLLNLSEQQQANSNRLKPCGDDKAPPPPNSPNSERKALVDLTDANNAANNANNAKEAVDADLEKAIKLSLQEANSNANASANTGSNFGVSQEEQDVSRALEASLLENQLAGQRKSRNGDNWIDPLNPHERERNGMWPVGLKNVGQTCWFSAVIQSLFYLPAFRSLVLNFPPFFSSPEALGEQQKKSGDEKASPEVLYRCERRKKIVEFMQELRKLFALMVASQRKYVDPSRAVDILRGSIGSLNQQNGKDFVNVETNNQQDVSEFTHIVLEWVEEAFKNDEINNKNTDDNAMMVDNEKENSEEKDGEKPSPVEAKKTVGENPMSRLFYGKVLTEGSIQGDPFVREEAFGQWPLQVNTFNDIHDSLENSTAHESLDAPGSLQQLSQSQPQSQQQSQPNSLVSWQERWFLRLPPVLFFELSRFLYNTERKTAEKIHNRLEFPDRIFVDRYVADNKQITRGKREEVRSLKEKRSQLKTRLDKFMQYGPSPDSNPGPPERKASRMALPDILQSTLDFATTLNVPAGGAPTVSLMQVDSPCGSPKVTPASSVTNLAVAVDGENRPSDDGEDIPMDVEMSPVQSDRDNNDRCEDEKRQRSDDPCPRHVSEVELKVLQNCLNRWKGEVEHEITRLESVMRGVDNEIENMYNDESLRKMEYQLHAVMVHEGSIDSGHYWAYVRDHRRKVWLKFNDNTVNEASWDELTRESMGGHSNTSAYSLVYIDTSKPDLLLDADWAGSIGETREDKMEEGELEALAVTLPQDLAQFVIDDNNAFHEEIVKWDNNKELQKQQQQQQQQQQQPQQQQQQPSGTPSLYVMMQKRLDEINGSQASNESGDVQVVQEKLTYVNNHAKLSIELTENVIASFEKAIAEKGAPTAVHMALEKVIKAYSGNFGALPDPNPEAGPKTELLPATDIRLESFVSYLLKNDETKNVPLVELAVLEQFAFPGLENNNPAVTLFRNAAENMLAQRRSKYQPDASALRKWHQAYHFFRRSVHCFVAGLEADLEHKIDEALDLFTEAYNFTLKAGDVQVQGSSKTLRPTLIVRHLCKVLPDVNRALIKQFKLGENLNEVVNRVQSLLVPVLVILQARVMRSQQTTSYQTADAQTLAEVRNEWCALLGDSDATNESAAAISDVLPLILELDMSTRNSVSKNRDLVDQKADVNLSNRYTQLVARLHKRDQLEP